MQSHLGRTGIGAAVLLTLLLAPPTGSQNLDLDQMAAALALPIVTGGQAGNVLHGTNGDVVIPSQTAVTLVTITNGKADPILLRLRFLDGDAGETWGFAGFDCELTGRETATLVFLAAGAGESTVFVECSDGVDTAGDPVALYTGMQNGMLFAAVADPDNGSTISEDILLGDAVVVDTAAGQAYGFEAIPFQAGPGQNDGDAIFNFDGQEYRSFPAVLGGNFIAPTSDVLAELVLFTLDGSAGILPAPRASVSGYAYNDDEVFFNLSHDFDCFDIVALEEINGNLAYTGGPIGIGSVSGHLELIPQPTAAPGPDGHDAEFGDANSIRRRGVHGWIVQSVDGALLPAGEPIAGFPGINVLGGPSAWARPLESSSISLIPFFLDSDSTLNAEQEN